MSLLESTLHLCQNLVLACAGGQVVHVHVDGMRLQNVPTEIYSVCLVGLVSLVARLLVFRNLRMRVLLLAFRRGLISRRVVLGHETRNLDFSQDFSRSDAQKKKKGRATR